MLADRPIILYANTVSKGYNELNQKYANMIAKHPKLGAKTINEEQLRSYIRKIIFETLDEMENEDAFHEIYDTIANCNQAIEHYYDSDNGKNINPDTYLLPYIHDLMMTIKKYRLSPIEYNKIIDNLPLPMADKMNYYYNDLSNFLENR